MRATKTVALAAAAVLGASVWALNAQGRPAGEATGPPPLVDAYQRSSEIYTYSTSAKSGPQRGEELYFIKCWFCHNQWAKNGPSLKGIYKRPKMLVGQPVNDQTVTNKIRLGGPMMPAYRHVLTDTDMADLLAYIKSPQCCLEAENPPPNPRYLMR